MRDSELELIAALVEGRLDDETQARALVESGPDYRAEYEAQRIAYEALATIEPAMLSEAERSGLRRDIWTDLRSTPVRQTPAPWYLRWAPVAAGMFVVVGLVAVLSQGGLFGGADSEDATTEIQASATTSAPAEGGVAADDGESAEAPEAVDQFSTPQARGLTGAQEEFFAAEASKVRAGDLSALSASPTADDESPSTSLQTCVDSAGLEDFEVVGVAASALENEAVDPLPDDIPPFIAAMLRSSSTENAPVAFVDASSCELLHVDG